MSPGPMAAFEVFLGALPPQRKKGAARAAVDAADLLPVRRDFAFVLARDVAGRRRRQGSARASTRS